VRTDWLQAFLTFSQTMNFTRAAAALNISQPALHVKIGKLAEWAGQPLYHKAGRNLVLTPAGEMAAAYAREEQERLLAFAGELRQGAGRRPVVLCAGNGAYLYLLGPAISQFSHDPAHTLSLLTGDRDRTLHLLLTGRPISASPHPAPRRRGSPPKR
jgi:DNA-binding transcriptional LysR family regulator